jgi:hypothetical protein
MGVKFMLNLNEDDAYNSSIQDNANWIKFLINNNATQSKRFRNILLQNKSIVLALIEYRRELFDEEHRGNIKLESLQKAYDKKNYGMFRLLLQELFLEYINDSQFKYILYAMTYNGWIPEGIYNEHIKDKNNRIACLVGVPMKI